MKVIFMGTGNFAIPSLKILMRDKYEIAAVITQPDRAKDRKGNIIEGELKKFAIESDLKVLQFDKIKFHVAELKALNPDFMITASYGQILTQEILDIAPVYNVHASLLPKYRGSAPIRWAIINGDKLTGVTIMKTELGLDTGDILSQSQSEIGDYETYDQLFNRLANLGAELLSKTLIALKNNQITPKKQDESLATKCKMIDGDITEIDWNKSATEICNLIRGLYPSPGASTTIKDKKIKILSAHVANDETIGVGKIKSDKNIFLIGCGKGNLYIDSLQIAGKKNMSTKEFLNGYRGLDGIVCTQRQI